MSKTTPGPYSVIITRCMDGSLTPAIKSDPAGSIVCFAHGRDEAEMHGNAHLIARLLNEHQKAKDTP